MNPFEWTPCMPFFAKQLPDGTWHRGPMMRRRRPDGSVEYRRMTDEEEFDWIASTAW